MSLSISYSCVRDWFSPTGCGTSSVSSSGVCGDTHDNDDTTYYGYYADSSYGDCGGGNSMGTYCESEQTWSNAVFLEQIDFKTYSWSYSHGNYRSRANYRHRCKVWVRQSGSWNEVFNEEYMNTNKETSYSWDKIINNGGSGYTNVTGVKVKVWAYGQSYEGNRHNEARTRVFTLDFKIYFDDVGVRAYDGSSIKKVGVRPLESSHKLRVRKGGTTYGIPLLDSSHPNATGFKVYDGSNFKNLPEFLG